MITIESEVTLTFVTQQQANDAVLALSNGYKVEQHFMSTTSTDKPYCVKVYIPSERIKRIEE